jgi:hypothetical protein
MKEYYPGRYVSDKPSNKSEVALTFSHDGLILKFCTASFASDTYLPGPIAPELILVSLFHSLRWPISSPNLFSPGAD